MGSQTSTSRHPPLVDLDDDELEAAAPPLPPGVRMHRDFAEGGNELLLMQHHHQTHSSCSSFGSSSSRRRRHSSEDGRAARRASGGFASPDLDEEQQQEEEEEEETGGVFHSHNMHAEEREEREGVRGCRSAKAERGSCLRVEEEAAAAAAGSTAAMVAVNSAAESHASQGQSGCTSSSSTGIQGPPRETDGRGEEEIEGGEEELIPCVFTWTHGGHSVYLTGSFNGWSLTNKIRLNRSGHEFSYIHNLPRGVHFYKFIVDDEWKFAPDQRTESDQHGNINNMLDISTFKGFDFALPSEIEQARGGQYHQSVPEPSEYSTDAPTIPILLGKSAHAFTDPPPLAGAGIPVHCLANHLFHDSFAPTVFGPHTSCVATTNRWRIPNARSTTSGQRYTTYIYVTVNPLYPFPSAAEDAASAGGGAAADDETVEDGCVTEAAAAAAAGVEAHPNPLANMLVYRRRDAGTRHRDETQRRTKAAAIRPPVKTS